MTPRVLWQELPADDGRARELADALGVPPVIARLLSQRGLADADDARRFLDPSLAQLHDPFLLTGMREAVDRLLAAVARRERVVIHGDYDVDGITSTVILRRVLEMLGADVGHFVPERVRDGYGLQPSTMDRLHADGARVVVSVDCGIRAGDAAQRARELGLDLIITDHHEPDLTQPLPVALAVINPKRSDCNYPDKYLAGVGVALKLVHGLLLAGGRGLEALPHFVKIAAIGTLADMVPLVGENRVIARAGLASLSASSHSAGLAALLTETGLLGRALDSFHVTFMLAPRINAAGRMQSPDLAVELLLLRGKDSATLARATQLAKQLCEENTRRREQESDIVQDARRLVDKDPNIGAHNVLVVAGDGWHRGVIGIVASKLVESYQKPSIVLSIDEAGVAHGSCRSIPGFDMLEALESCADVLLKFGGHKQAAGVTLEAARVTEFRQRMAAWGNARLDVSDLVPRLSIDAPLGLREISGAVVEALAKMGPFGMSNPKPIFRARPVELVELPRRLKERHLSMVLRQDGRAFRGISWRGADRETYLVANRKGLELAYSVDQNDFRGERTTELTVADVRMPVEA